MEELSRDRLLATADRSFLEARAACAACCSALYLCALICLQSSDEPPGAAETESAISYNQPTEAIHEHVCGVMFAGCAGERA